ncbi:MAG: PHP domain-containing protein [Candidatus Dormibacteraeota bacterium]|nr:PHP domain-containing protein [Candidatus Dormibacteraeota bacterium]
MLTAERKAALDPPIANHRWLAWLGGASAAAALLLVLLDLAEAPRGSRLDRSADGYAVLLLPRVDLHLHTSASFDCRIEPELVLERCRILGLGPVAVTDHDTIAAAAQLKRLAPHAIVVGQEITMATGELIGLFMEQSVAGGLTARETALRIRDQGGLVYLQHPYDRFRRRCGEEAIESISDLIDVVEVYNGRSEEEANSRAEELCESLGATAGAGSDAHSLRELGSVYIEMEAFTGAQDFLQRLSEGRIVRRPNRFRLRLDAGLRAWRGERHSALGP